VRGARRDYPRPEELRAKLGPLPSGLTEKNKTLLRQFDDPRLVAR